MKVPPAVIGVAGQWIAVCSAKWDRARLELAPRSARPMCKPTLTRQGVTGDLEVVNGCCLQSSARIAAEAISFYASFADNEQPGSTHGYVTWPRIAVCSHKDARIHVGCEGEIAR